uniref:Uncharacterized protein n=1 Tax=Tanacetum cinerariifolium TaxID=118510 RepID=A0A6L2K8Z9_TANCI|nr:hypothetical protein [Tanacetum cinerariifolium]
MRNVKAPVKEPEAKNAEKEPEQETQDTGPIPITIIRTITKLALEIEMIGSSSRLQLTDTILEVQLINAEIQAYMEIEEQKEKDIHVAKLMALSKPELFKVVHEEVTKAGVDPKHLDNDRRNFDVHNPFNFGDFKVTKLDELGPIIQKKKNKVVGELVTSLGKRYDRQKVIPKEPEINPTLHVPGQVLSLTSRRKRKH